MKTHVAFSKSLMKHNKYQIENQISLYLVMIIKSACVQILVMKFIPR